MIRRYLILLVIVIHTSFFAILSAEAQVISPFDVKKTALTINYDGHDFMSVFNKYIGKGKIEKGTYESTEEFSKRLDTNKTNIYAFKISLKKESGEFEYDADKEIFKIRGNKITQVSGRVDSIVIYYNAREAGSYMASNAIKQKVKVTKYDITMHVLEGENWRSTEWINSDFSFSCQRSEAKKLSDSLSALVIINPRAASIGDIVKTPTINWPHEWKGKRYSVKGEFLDLWIFDDKSGKILFKYNAMVDEKNRQAYISEARHEAARMAGLKNVMTAMDPDGDWQQCNTDELGKKRMGCYYNVKKLKKKVSKGWGLGEYDRIHLLLVDNPNDRDDINRDYVAHGLLSYLRESKDRLENDIYFFAILIQTNVFQSSSRDTIVEIYTPAINYYNIDGASVASYRYKTDSDWNSTGGRGIYPYVKNIIYHKNVKIQ